MVMSARSRYGEGSPCLNLPVLPIERSEEDSAQRNRWELRAVPSRGLPTEQSVRFRVGDMPPLAVGFSDLPDTARGILDALIPGSTIVLVPGSEFAEGKQNWLGASGKTQIAVMLAETLWRSGAVDMVVWISATSRSAVLAGYVEAWVAVTGIEPTGTAESVAARFVSWLAATRQPWLAGLRP